MAETRVSDDTQVESEEGDEAGVGEGFVERENGEDGFEEERETGVLGEEETSVVEAVEEGEEVSDG